MLSAFFPVPARLPLGGTNHLVMPLQVRDLAALETAATGGLVACWQQLAAAEAEPDTPSRHAALKAAYDAAEAGLPSFGGDAVSAWLASPLGRLETLWLSVRKSEPGLTRADLAGPLLAATAEEWTLCERVLWALDPLDETARVIDREIGVRFAGGEPGDLARLCARLCRRLRWPPEQIGALYLPQLDALLSADAEKPSHPYAEPEKPPKGWSWARLQKEVNGPRAAFWKAT